MSYKGPKAFLRAVAELGKLPGIGERTASRLVFRLTHWEPQQVAALAQAIADIKQKIRLCSVCMGLSEDESCSICLDSARDQALICVIEDPSDLFSIERSGRYRGVYHVLHGALAPLDGVGPEELKINELIRRVEKNRPREVILATNPSVEGEATALYLAKRLHDRGVLRTSRIAMGIPMGGHLEFLDQVTLGRAIAERREFSAS